MVNIRFLSIPINNPLPRQGPNLQSLDILHINHRRLPTPITRRRGKLQQSLDLEIAPTASCKVKHAVEIVRGPGGNHDRPATA